MTEYLNTYLQNYKQHIISQYIDLDASKVKNEGCLSQVETFKTEFDKYNQQFGFESSTIDDICQKLTDSLNNFYLQDIKQKKKGCHATI